MSKDKYANKKRELLAWAKNDIIPTDLQWLCESAADIIGVLQSALVTATREFDKAKTENVDLQAGINSGVAIYDRLWAELDKHRWIPVGERLPDDACTVFVVMVQGSESWGFLANYNTTQEKWESYDPMVKSRITHWKPIILPEGE